MSEFGVLEDAGEFLESAVELFCKVTEFFEQEDITPAHLRVILPMLMMAALDDHPEIDKEKFKGVLTGAVNAAVGMKGSFMKVQKSVMH
ncbi:MAG: hypothetical protein VW683_10060 [Betaproteobacteria bacterium]